MPQSLADLVGRWEEIAKHAATYNLTLDDWLNDLDLRDMIARQMSDALTVDDSLRPRLEAADQAFRAATRESNRSMWGPTAGGEHHATRHWWYFRYPSSPGSEMRRDLTSAGILPQGPS